MHKSTIWCTLGVIKSYFYYFMYFFGIEYKGSINNEMWLFGKLQLTWIVMKKMWESFWRERDAVFLEIPPLRKLSVCQLMTHERSPQLYLFLNGSIDRQDWQLPVELKNDWDLHKQSLRPLCLILAWNQNAKIFTNFDILNCTLMISLNFHPNFVEIQLLGLFESFKGWFHFVFWMSRKRRRETIASLYI